MDLKSQKTYLSIGCRLIAQSKSNAMPKSCKIYKKAKPLDQLVVKSLTLIWYFSVNWWTHRKRFFSKPLTASEFTNFWPSKHNAMVHINPRVSFVLPPTISSLEIFINLTPFSLSTCKTLLTLFIWCTRIRPFSRFYWMKYIRISFCNKWHMCDAQPLFKLTYFWLVSISNSANNLCPSRKSVNRSLTAGHEVFESCELIHLVNVFFCTSCRSSGK